MGGHSRELEGWGYPFDIFLVCYSCPGLDYQASSNKSDREVPSRVPFKGKQSCFRVYQTSGCRCLIHLPLPCSCASSESDKDAGNLGSKVWFPWDRRQISFHRQVDCMLVAFISVAKSRWNDTRWPLRQMAHIRASLLYGSSWPNSAGRLLKNMSSSTRWPVKFNLSYNWDEHRGSEEVCLRYCPDSVLLGWKCHVTNMYLCISLLTQTLKVPPHQNLEAWGGWLIGSLTCLWFPKLLLFLGRIP